MAAIIRNDEVDSGDVDLSPIVSAADTSVPFGMSEGVDVLRNAFCHCRRYGV